MKLAREVFDGGNDARSRTIHGVADHGEAAIADGIEQLPTRKHREGFKIAGSRFGVRGGEDQVLGLQSDDFFEIHLRPILRGVHDAGGVGSAERVGDESVSADGDERVSPDDEENAARREGFQFGVQRREAGLEIGGECFAGFGDAEEIGELLRGGENFIDVLGAGGVGGDAESVECANGVEAIDLLGNKNEIRVKGGNFFQIRIDGAADFPFLLRVGRIVAVIGVADEAVLHAEGVERFGQAGRKRNDARRKLRDANGAAELVHDFAHDRRRGRRRGGRERLAAKGEGAEQECSDAENSSAMHGIGNILLHESPLTRVPREA